MREEPKDPGRIEHILDAISKIENCRKSYTEHQILTDPIAFYGFVKLIEIIGEAAWKLTNELKERYPNIPWKKIQGMRHVLVHDYYMIDPETILKTIDLNILPLKEDILGIYQDLI